MLNFLSNVVKDVMREMPTPELAQCDENDRDQLWSMNLEAKWQ